MDYISQIRNIITILRENGDKQLSEEIQMLLDTSFVSSELLMSTTHRLNQAVKDSSKIKALIGSQVKELQSFCKSIGLIIK